MGNGAKGDGHGHGVNSHIVLLLGVALIAVPLLVAMLAPDVYGDVQQFLRIIVALGGGLVGSFIPGFLKVRFPGVEALGGMAVFALILMYDPLWRVNATLEVEATQEPAQPALDTAPNIDSRPSGADATTAEVPGDPQRVDDCLAQKISEYQAPMVRVASGGARASGPGIGGGTKRARESVCLSVGPEQEVIDAETRNTSCHGGRCSVTAPAIEGKQVCVTASAWSESKSFGGGGSGQYELIVRYRNVATDDTRGAFLAQCRGSSPQ
jgi:hypothetical protein